MLSFQSTHPSWHATISKALKVMDQSYLEDLNINTEWLPGKDKIFNAFSLPKQQTQYILWGESPYPRKNSANGFAFWDQAVSNIWSETGLSKPVNRATSLRNFIKMLLVARGDLSLDHLNQAQIAVVDKTVLVTSLQELFENLMTHGFLLLNASLVLSERKVAKEAKFWEAFMSVILEELEPQQNIQLILFGNVAKSIGKLAAPYDFQKITAEHPYNLSFISNPTVLDFFRPFDLLKKM